MAQRTTSQQISLSGKVIEVVNQCGKPTAKVSIDPFFVDVVAGGIQDAHLGDAVVIDAIVTTERIRLALDAQCDGFKTTKTKT
jgi:hypothetical protein